MIRSSVSPPKCDGIDGEAVAPKLFRPEEVPDDRLLLRIEITREPDHLHPVPQRFGDSREGIRGRHEKDVREIEVQLQVVIGEGLVLFRVQHFQESRAGIPVEILGEFVHLVEEEDGTP